jgi:hypothetical protein
MKQPSLFYRVKSGLSVLYKYHGLWFPFVLVQRAWLYAARKWGGSRTFEFGGQTHVYYVHPYSLNNERIVEVALARDFLNNKSGETLEIGNVLSYYFHFPHDIVDKYEIAPGVINEDVITFSPGKKYDQIITLSTLEHVGWDEPQRDPKKMVLAIHHLKSLLKDAGRMLVTLPLGYNPHVDELINTQQTGFDEVRYLLRISAGNRWREATLEEIRKTPYGSPFPCANAVFVGIFQAKAADRLAVKQP